MNTEQNNVGNTIRIREGSGSGISTFLVTVGGALVVAGAGLLVYMGILIVDVLRDPQSVGLVNQILSATGRTGEALSGKFGDASFRLHLDEPVNTLLFVIASIWVLSAFANIVSSIIRAGTGLIDNARNWSAASGN